VVFGGFLQIFADHLTITIESGYMVVIEFNDPSRLLVKDKRKM
jgi:hypothetical protein